MLIKCIRKSGHRRVFIMGEERHQYRLSALQLARSLHKSTSVKKEKEKEKVRNYSRLSKMKKKS